MAKVRTYEVKIFSLSPKRPLRQNAANDGLEPIAEQAAMPMSGGHRREASCRLHDNAREPVSAIYNLGRDILVDAE